MICCHYIIEIFGLSFLNPTYCLSDKDIAKYEGHLNTSELDRDSSLKISCLPPARIAMPGGHKVINIACGLQHTVMLTEHGEFMHLA